METKFLALVHGGWSYRVGTLQMLLVTIKSAWFPVGSVVNTHFAGRSIKTRLWA